MTGIFEDLKKRFAVMTMGHLGECIIIPGKELDLDWILTFLEEKHYFEGTMLDDEPVVLVQLKPMEAP